MDDADETLVIEVDRWFEDPRLEIPAELSDNLSDLSSQALLQGLLAALEEQFPGAVAVHTDELDAEGGTSAPLMIPGTSLHISLRAVPRSLVNAIAGTGVLWAVGGVPGPRAIAATATTSTAMAFFQVLTKLSPEQAAIVRFVALAAHRDGACPTTAVETEFGTGSVHTLDGLKRRGILVESAEGWSATF